MNRVHFIPWVFYMNSFQDMIWLKIICYKNSVCKLNCKSLQVSKGNDLCDNLECPEPKSSMKITYTLIEFINMNFDYLDHGFYANIFSHFQSKMPLSAIIFSLVIILSEAGEQT